MIKQQVYDHCLSIVEARISSIQVTIDSYRKASFDESKSSMGDKYETTKSMLQYEQEKMSTQLQDALKMKKALLTIGCKNPLEKVAAGSLIKTSGPIFYLTVSLGKVSVDSEDILVISPVSPIAQQLLSKREGEKIMFNNQQIYLLEIF